MEPWIETYRGAVSPWETDVTEHFTVAFYFDRIAMAEATLAERARLARYCCAPAASSAATTCAMRGNCARAALFTSRARR